MRTLIFVVFALFTVPAFAQSWDHYENGRLGFGIDIPPGFVGNGESDNGDGQTYYREQGAAKLLVWGAYSMEDFDTDVSDYMRLASNDGWNISYQAAVSGWASFSGSKGGQILYQRMVVLCDGASFAAFRAEYAERDAANMKPVVQRLVKTLRDSAC